MAKGVVMDFKNAVFNQSGGIDAEIEHPVHGWIPTTLRADDPDTAELYEKAKPDAAPAPAPNLADAKAVKRADIETARQAAEADGVTIEGIRYAGDPSNRQALSEALDLAAITDQTHYARWKDSDGTFHDAHPVADVHAALLAIGQRRGELIDREGALSAQIDAADDVATLEAIQW